MEKPQCFDGAAAIDVVDEIDRDSLCHDVSFWKAVSNRAEVRSQPSTRSLDIARGLRRVRAARPLVRSLVHRLRPLCCHRPLPDMPNR